MLMLYSVVAPHGNECTYTHSLSFEDCSYREISNEKTIYLCLKDKVLRRDYVQTETEIKIIILKVSAGEQKVWENYTSEKKRKIQNKAVRPHTLIRKREDHIFRNIPM